MFYEYKKILMVNKLQSYRARFSLKIILQKNILLKIFYMKESINKNIMKSHQPRVIFRSISRNYLR